MAEGGALVEFKTGLRKLRDGHPQDALTHFQNAAEMEPQNPYYMSFTGVAHARTQGKPGVAIKLCETALTLKRNEAQLHLNLAEVYVAAGRRGDALTTLDRAAASFGRHRGVQRARLRLGSRRAPVLSFLGRDNALNKQLGIWRHRLLDWADGTRLPLLHSSS
jgi:Flp pilus assembly protein TadD